MDFHLTVIAAFADYAVGAVIKDAKAVAFAFEHHPHSVVKIVPQPAALSATAPMPAEPVAGA
jgi:hypothetical protein